MLSILVSLVSVLNLSETEVLMKQISLQVVVYDPGAWQSGAHFRTTGLQQVPPGHSAHTDPLPC